MKLQLLRTLTLILIFGMFSCSKKSIPVTQEPKTLNDFIVNNINSGTITQDPIYWMNEQRVVGEDLTLLLELPYKDFTDLKILGKRHAIKKYGDEGKNGAIILTPMVDEQLTMKYYEGIENQIVLEKIDELIKKGMINKNPILILEGIPLKGDAIATDINNLSQDAIQEIFYLKKPSAYRIYGIRAINGVLIIDKKKGSEKEGTKKVRIKDY